MATSAFEYDTTSTYKPSLVFDNQLTERLNRTPSLIEKLNNFIALFHLSTNIQIPPGNIYNNETTVIEQYYSREISLQQAYLRTRLSLEEYRNARDIYLGKRAKIYNIEFDYDI